MMMEFRACTRGTLVCGRELRCSFCVLYTRPLIIDGFPFLCRFRHARRINPTQASRPNPSYIVAFPAPYLCPSSSCRRRPTDTSTDDDYYYYDYYYVGRFVYVCVCVMAVGFADG